MLLNQMNIHISSEHTMNTKRSYTGGTPESSWCTENNKGEHQCDLFRIFKFQGKMHTIQCAAGTVIH